VQRPCLGCSRLIERGSRCAECKPKNLHYERGKRGRTSSDHRWRKLSNRLRKASPFCEFCSATNDLTADHIIPLSERPDLAHDELNCRVLCRTCNGERGDRCTNTERDQVLMAIELRRKRQQSYYMSSGGTNDALKGSHFGQHRSSVRSR
jgi:5-methylcytosine-specific restriction endonuclease McrA